MKTLKYPTHPFQSPLSKLFFEDVKANRLEKIQNYLKDDPTLVYEFDNDN
jgi:hypothetical protein